MALHVIEHPLITHRVSLLREHGISTKQFRELTNELATMLVYEATKHYKLAPVTMTNWQCNVEQLPQLAGENVTLVPILRAGLGMLDGALTLLPNAKVSVVGIKRNEETLKAEAYYENLVTHLEERNVLIIDPMLATGGSLIATIDKLKEKGAKSIQALVLVTAPEGAKALEKAHPDVEIFTAALDDHLNDKGYIMPGLGDAGDKLFGTT